MQVTTEKVEPIPEDMLEIINTRWSKDYERHE